MKKKIKFKGADTVISKNYIALLPSIIINTLDYRYKHLVLYLELRWLIFGARFVWNEEVEE